MDLRETTSYLLRLPDVGAWVKLADNYIQTYNRYPARFVLPSEHALLRPIIEAFATDATAFANYIRAVRDACTGIAYDELHALYRTVSVRALQVVRRTRLRRAVLILLPDIEAKLGYSIGYDDQQRVAKFLEQTWGDLRMQTMSLERARFQAKRLDSSARTSVLDQFWADLDAQLDQGRVVLGDRDLQDIINLLQP